VSLLSTLQDQRDALDALIGAVKHAQSVGLFIAGVIVEAPRPAVVDEIIQGRLAAPPPAPAAAREKSQRRPKPATPATEPAAPAAEAIAEAIGQWDRRIIEAVKLGDSAFGVSAEDVRKAVAGRKAEPGYQTVYSALRRLADTGQLRRDKRFYFPPMRSDE
jgi:hypothetical protein